MCFTQVERVFTIGFWEPCKTLEDHMNHDIGAVSMSDCNPKKVYGP